MTSERISCRELTADHIGRTVSVSWPNAGDGVTTHAVTGGLESITQYRTKAGAELRVGPLTFSVELVGPVEVFLHEE
jgi:hypothetical protein